jgi:hypothetical protein
MKTKGKISDYVKANRKGNREAEFEVSAGWTSKTKIHKSKKQYDRKGRNRESDSDLFRFKNVLCTLCYRYPVSTRQFH